jgi:hypothetical protein
VEVALVAAARNCTLVLPTVLHQWFRLPPRVRAPSEQQCEDIRCMQAASKSALTRRRATVALGALSFEDARAQTFRALFAHPSAAPSTPTAFRTAVHLRTVSDVACHTHVDIRSCQRSCLRDQALKCVVRHARPPVLILSDTRKASARLKRLFHDAHVWDVWDESVVVDARNHSGLSRRAAQQTLLLWAAFYDAEVRFASGISTFSKSALLSRSATDYVVDTRCYKAHRTDGDLYTCRRSSLRRDLVRL